MNDRVALVIDSDSAGNHHPIFDINLDPRSAVLQLPAPMITQKSQSKS